MQEKMGEGGRTKDDLGFSLGGCGLSGAFVLLSTRIPVTPA
jgi:hypothetical protein